MTASSIISRGKKILIGAICIAVVGGVGFLALKKPSVIETDFFVPIETDIASRSITVITPQSGGINIRVRGPAKAIARLSQKPARIHFDNIKAGNGIQTIRIDSRKIGFGPDVSVVSIRPPMATIRIEPLIEKILPILAVLTGKPSVGFTVVETTVNPDNVRIRGPESVISAQTQIQMKPLDISGISESFHQRIVLDLPDGLKPIQPDQFTLEITVKEKIVSNRLSDIPIEGRGTPRAFRISPSFLTMTVKGPFRTVQRLNTNPDFSVYVDLSGLDPGVYVRRAVIVLPVNTTLLKTVPELFTVRIDVKKKKEG